jgi:hypothetical protein
MADLAGNADTTKDDNGNVVNQYEAMKGFFCTTYTVQTPPSGWGLQNGLSVAPAVCQSVKEMFFLSETVNNFHTFFQSPDQKTTIMPVIADAMNINVVPAGSQTLPGTDAFSSGAVNGNGQISFNYSGDYLMLTKVFFAVRDPKTSLVIFDQFLQPLSRFLYLPFLSPDIKNNILFHVLPALQIGPVNHSGDSCFNPFVEGSEVVLFIKNPPFKNEHINYSWTAAGLASGNTNEPTLTLTDLPAAQTSFVVTVKMINEDTGCIATGSATFKTYTAEVAGVTTRLCHYRHLLYPFVNPKLINPLGPDGPEFTRYAADNFRQISRTVSQLGKLIGEMNERGDMQQIL